MRAGRLRDRVTLQSPTKTRDSAGGPVETFADVTTVWAEVIDLGGKSIMEARAAGSQVTRRVAIRPRPDLGITSAWRVKFADNSVAKLAFHPLRIAADEVHLQCEMVNG